ncbi:hypothetical protein O159_15040 [Leifsonia xyli subsp. cynodontis DSM 46306]|uniref:Transcription factor zinc-finger domain-containing protein n=1 Tax=Leifsonia xyli subsp. cynodontis DSM 46306 TaxID=1389489 RepID=U3P6W6_LEIXC|nr:zf-TFIIB domain-containing protein [Leifsonia xyli]AGW41556.1 hypothetical protein O159_15040 [Leifsonia xyli subsp. cynodontis DSM 46306]
MKCPTDNSTLIMSERTGIEIDYCPECRGVWLDRGELDKIIERSAVPAADPTPARYDEQRLHPHNPYPQKKRRENWLSELFD